MRRRTWILQLALLASVTACGRANVQTTESYLGPPMPRPDRIYVSYYSITPDQVRLDQGIAARIERAAGDQMLGAQEMQAAQATQTALANGIVDRLRRYGLPAEVTLAMPRGGNDLLVQGQIVGIDEGNRTRRMLIGLGAGKSTVSADTQIYRLTATAPPRFVTAFEGQADSGRMPGAAETMGAGAAAQRAGESTALSGGLHAGAEGRKTSDTAEAGALADAIASRVAQLAVAQGWIPPMALH
jgi:hypothetical protein